MTAAPGFESKPFIPEETPHLDKLPVDGVIGVNTGDVVYLSPEGIDEYDLFIFSETEAGGALTVQGKVNSDDAAFSADLSLVDLHVANPNGARVTSAPGNTKRFALLGNYYQIQVKQSGATASNVKGKHMINKVVV